MNCQVILLLVALTVGLVSSNCPINLVIKSGDTTLATLNKEIPYNGEEIVNYGADKNLRVHCNEENGVGANLVEACTETNCIDNVSNCAVLNVKPDDTLECISST